MAAIGRTSKRMAKPVVDVAEHSDGFLVIIGRGTSTSAHLTPISPIAPETPPEPSARLRVPATVLLSAWQQHWSGALGDGHDHSQRHATPARYRTRYTAPLGLARCRGPHRNEVRLRHRAMRRLHGPHQRAAAAVLLGADRECRRR